MRPRMGPLVALAAALLASEAPALTCAPPDPLRSYAEAQASPDRYVVLRGTLSFDAALLPGTAPGAPPEEPALGAPEERRAGVPAAFRGEALTPAGWERAAIREVVLVPVCLGPWCGTATPGRDVLLFAREAEAGWEVELSPCGGRLFEDPDPAAIEALPGLRRAR